MNDNTPGSLRSNFEIEKDLEIKDLKNEIKHLKAQVRKYKKVAESSKQKPPTKREISKGFQESIQKNIKAKDKYKQMAHENNMFAEFIKQRIVRMYGHDSWIEIVNSVHNPKKSTMITDPCKKGQFKVHGKGV
jgi:hypothetical protein